VNLCWILFKVSSGSRSPCVAPRRPVQGLWVADQPGSGLGVMKRSNASKCDLTNDERRCESSFRSGMTRESNAGHVAVLQMEQT
jgi:hypothetical protein